MFTIAADDETITTEEQKQHALALRIEAHYFSNEAIKAEMIDKIRSIPAVIVQERHDIICPIATAYKLHHAWPEADYVVVPGRRHIGVRSADPFTADRSHRKFQNHQGVTL